MRSIAQIQQKAKKLKRQLTQRICIHENFGDGAQLLLSQYIGDIYSYPYDDRLVINTITSNFFNWCATYHG